MRAQYQVLLGALVILQLYFIGIWSNRGGCNCPPNPVTPNKIYFENSSETLQQQEEQTPVKKYKVAHFDESHWIYFYGPWRDVMEVNEDCPVECEVVHNFTADSQPVDALLVNYQLKPPDEWKKTIAPRWVVFSQESLAKFPVLKSEGFTKDYTYTAYYERTSDIPFPYRDFKYRNTFFNKPNFKNKTGEALVAAFITQCHVDFRVEYIRELEKYIKIDHYGPCNNNKPFVPKGDHMHPTPGKTPFDMLYDPKIETLKQYKFTLALENSIGVDYVTEKLYHPFMAGSIPIYKGAPNVIEFLPGPHSAVLVDDFATPKELAEFVTKVGNDEKLWLSFFEYQKYGISNLKKTNVDAYIKHTLPCLVCMKMAEDDKKKKEDKWKIW